MSSITAADGRYIEAILDMSRGYVLHFTDATFGDFYNRYNIDILRSQISGIRHF